MDVNKLSEIQKWLVGWTKYNFGEYNKWESLLGIIEEIGELSHSYLKKHQGIRLNENHDENIKDAIGDCVVFSLNYLNAFNISFDESLLNNEINHNSDLLVENSIFNLCITISRLCQNYNNIDKLDNSTFINTIKKEIGNLLIGLESVCLILNIEFMRCVDMAIETIRKRDYRDKN